MNTKADWLRSEIEKLEGMINTSEADGHAHDPARAYEEGWNDALTSIITWYKEELKVLENVEQYKCKSYFDENNTLQDCTCKKCS